MTDLPLTPSPQFGTAEYIGTPGGDHCQFCHQLIGGTYYRINASMACSACAEKMRGELAKDTHGAFVRAILFGVGAAVLGMILYATFEIVTGIIIGYAALAVGWMVGKAMIMGSNGVGGRRYQIVAILLTYAAVSTAAIPVWIHYSNKEKPAQQQTGQTNGNPPQSPQEDAQPKTRPSFVAALGTLLLLGLASPFLELTGNPLSGLIGIVILFVGLRFAWRFTAARRPEVVGPFDNTPQPAQ